MTNTSTLKRLAYMSAMAAAFLLAAGTFTEANAQRDPFKKAGWATVKTAPNGGKPGAGGSTTAVAVNYGPPDIEARIEYYKRLRENAAAQGTPIPKVTSVLTLNEMAVTGIFKTPRGYAAMVEATPIKLSYTIYPGERFFDGQLVAVEENQLIFKKVSKVGANKYVASVEHKPLMKYTTKAQVEGTAPVQNSTRPVQMASTAPAPAAGAKAGKTPASNPFLSPLDEMNKQPDSKGSDTEKPAKSGKKPLKVAKK